MARSCCPPTSIVPIRSRCCRVAAAAAAAGAPISREALLELARIARPIPEPWPEHARRSLLNLLSAGQGMIGTIEELDHYDLFQLLIPEWENVRSRPQRNAFHRFTVDRHLLETVANAAMLARDVSRPDLLLFGALLHDLGKGRSGDHTDEGVMLGAVILHRIGVHSDDAARVVNLIRNHLLLGETATRRDLSDPRTAQTVAEAVGDIEQLNLLRTLTEADARATGPTAWTGWRIRLIDELVERTAAQLEGRKFPDVVGFPAPRHAGVLSRTGDDGRAHVEALTTGEISTCVIAAPDRPGLLANMVGALAMHGADVVSADVWTTEDGTAVDEFSVVRRLGGDTDWSRVEHDLRAAMTGTLDLPAKLRPHAHLCTRTQGTGRRRAPATGGVDRQRRVRPLHRDRGAGARWDRRAVPPGERWSRSRSRPRPRQGGDARSRARRRLLRDHPQPGEQGARTRARTTPCPSVAALSTTERPD